jgi:hypothetical protein
MDGQRELTTRHAVTLPPLLPVRRVRGEWVVGKTPQGPRPSTEALGRKKGGREEGWVPSGRWEVALASPLGVEEPRRGEADRQCRQAIEVQERQRRCAGDQPQRRQQRGRIGNAWQEAACADGRGV